MKTRVLGIVGAGQMGCGIAEVAIVSDVKVIMVDASPDALKRALERIERHLDKGQQKGKISEDQRHKALGLVATTCNLGELSQCDFIIEAASESVELKARIFSQLDEFTAEYTVLASNTSSISITRIASFTKRPEKVIGMHFFNPVPVMRLVEIIRGENTSEETYQKTLELAQALGKVAVEAKDLPGFISSRLIFSYMNEGIWALYEGLGTPKDIDTIMRLGANHPMGPLGLADFVGLDTVLSVMRVLQEAFGDKYRPCPLLVRLVEAGRLGVKVGRGIYDYSERANDRV